MVSDHKIIYPTFHHRHCWRTPNNNNKYNNNRLDLTLQIYRRLEEVVVQVQLREIAVDQRHHKKLKDIFFVLCAVIFLVLLQRLRFCELSMTVYHVSIFCNRLGQS